MRGQSLSDFLAWDFDSESLHRMESELKRLLKTKRGIDRIDAFVSLSWTVTCVPVTRRSISPDAANLVPAATFSIDGLITEAIGIYLSGLIEDKHREHIVRLSCTGHV